MDKIKLYFTAMAIILCLMLGGCSFGDINSKPEESAQSEMPEADSSAGNQNSRIEVQEGDVIFNLLADEEMQKLFAAAEPALTISGTPDYSDISTEELLKMANEPYRDENGLTVLDRLGENDVFYTEEEAEDWTGASGQETGWTEFDASLYEEEGLLEYHASELRPDGKDGEKADIPAEIAALIPFGMKDSDTYMEDDTSRMLILPGRTQEDFDEAVRLAVKEGFSDGTAYSVGGMKIYEALKDDETVLTIMLNESALMISLE